MEIGEASRASPQVVKHSSPPTPRQFPNRGLCNVPAPVLTSTVTQFAELCGLSQVKDWMRFGAASRHRRALSPCNVRV